MRARGVVIIGIASVLLTLFGLYLILGRHHLILRLLGLPFAALGGYLFYFVFLAHQF